jgi:hypothetical protein
MNDEPVTTIEVEGILSCTRISMVLAMNLAVTRCKDCGSDYQHRMCSFNVATCSLDRIDG